VILTEAIIDALSMWIAGFRNVTAAYGINGLTDDILASFKAAGIEHVFLAFDPDEAGNRGAQAVALELIRARIKPWRVVFPAKLDANAYAATVKPAARRSVN
jgi:DNA primase